MSPEEHIEGLKRALAEHPEEARRGAEAGARVLPLMRSLIEARREASNLLTGRDRELVMQHLEDAIFRVYGGITFGSFL